MCGSVRQCTLVIHGLALLLAAGPPAAADPGAGTRPDYAQAMKFSADFLRQFTYDASVQPQWIGGTDVFWYSFRTSNGITYWKVNPRSATKAPLFDHVKLATALSEAAKKPHEPTALALERGRVNAEGTKFTFVADEYQYEWDLPTEKLTKGARAPREQAPPGMEGLTEEQRQRLQELRGRMGRRDGGQQGQEGRGRPGGPQRGRGEFRSTAPDRKAYLVERNHNLYLVETDNPVERLSMPTGMNGLHGALATLWSLGQRAATPREGVQLGSDGAEEYSFTTMATFGAGMDDEIGPPRIEWSRDSRSFFATRIDSRGVKELFVINTLAQPRPVLEQYKYPVPGEDAVRRMELHVGDRDGKKLTRVKPRWKDETYAHLQWGKTSDELRFVRRDRLWRNVELCSVNVRTGDCKSLVLDGFDNAHVAFQAPQFLDETNEVIWWSERSGWGHFYLYDEAGKLKNPITHGPYRAGRIIAVDAPKRLLYFTGNGREPGVNVNYDHLYVVNLDGTGLTLLTPGDATHRPTLSPSRQYLVDNCSRVDAAPVAWLRDAAGNEVMRLEEADLSRLREVGWRMPETFTVKAADGVTDLYGNLWKPFDFDPARKYPIIAHVYPGPQTEGVTTTFSAFSSNQQLAQLGFIVVQVGHRGGAPTRSKAYGTYGYQNLRDYGLADKKAAIEQLAARHSFIDVERVGIFGHSGGGFMSAAAVLQKPYNEFFKAAVASAGNHDNNVYNNAWSERYHGMKEVAVKEETRETRAADGGGAGGNGAADDRSLDESKNRASSPATRFEIKVPTNAELAANLKGALMLVHGEMDNNVHPAGTMRLVDALIRANKRFDMLILPGKRHGFGDYQPYVTQRTWEFFAEHLLGERPTGADILDKQGR